MKSTFHSLTPAGPMKKLGKGLISTSGTDRSLHVLPACVKFKFKLTWCKIKKQHPLPFSTTVFRSRRQLHQVCPPWHHSHGNSSESGGGACPGPGGQTDSAGEPATGASNVILTRRTRWHFTGVIAGSLLLCRNKSSTPLQMLVLPVSLVLQTHPQLCRALSHRQSIPRRRK